MADYIYLVQMDLPAEKEADFNRIYDTQHVSEFSKVPGSAVLLVIVWSRPTSTVSQNMPRSTSSMPPISRRVRPGRRPRTGAIGPRRSGRTRPTART